MDPLSAPEVADVFYDGPVIIYARLSKNPDGTYDSVPVQLSSGRRRCARLWPGRPTLEFADDNKRASDDNVYRPGYEAMLDAIRDGKGTDVYARMQNRITRLPGQWSEFRKVCTAAGIPVLHTAKGTTGLAPGQALQGKVQNLFDEEFTEMVKLGVMDSLDERAEQGRPHGGRPYGYEHGRDATRGATYVIVEGEAVVILRVAELILAGWNLANICRELDRQGYKRRKGTPWAPSGIKRIVTNPVVAGMHVRHGEATGRRGNWEPILDVATFDAVRAILTQPVVIIDTNAGRKRKRTFTRKRTKARVYVLTGIAQCGLCDTYLIGQRRVLGSGEATFHYVCSKGEGGCGQMSIMGPPFERYVIERYLAFVQSPAFLDFVEAVDIDAGARQKLQHEEDALKQRRRDLGASAVAGRLSVEAAEAAEVRFATELADIDRRRAELAPLTAGVRDPEAIVVGWDFMPLDEQRACLFDARATVKVGSANGRRWIDDPDAEATYFPARCSVAFGQAPAAIARASARRKRKAVATKASRGKSSTQR